MFRRWPWALIALLLLTILQEGRAQDSSMWILDGANVPVVRANGILILPAPLDPTDYIVGNMFDETVPDEQGRFEMSIRRDGVTLTAAVPASYADEENVWLTINARLPEEGAPRGEAPEIVIDATSTARGLLAMHPFFLNPDPYKVDLVLATIETLPEFGDLTNSVLNDYPTQPLPFDQPLFLQTFTDAVTALIEALPGPASEEIDSGRAVVESRDASSPDRYQTVRPASPQIRVQQLDAVRELRWSSKSADALIVENDIGNPLDTFVTLQRIDPDATYEYREGTTAMETLSFDSIEAAFGLRNKPPAYPYLGAAGIDRSVTMTPARSIYSYADVFGQLVDLLADAVGFGADPSTLALEADPDALYVLRGLNGRFVSGFEAGEFGYAWNNYRADYTTALALNILNGSLEFVAIFVDLGDILGTCAQKIFIDIETAVVTELGDNVITELSPGQIAPLMGTVARAGASSALTCANERLLELAANKPLRGLLAVGKSLLKTINLLGKVAKVGSLWERVTTLTGFPFGLATNFITPMTTGLVVVGDPFSPRIASVNGVDAASPTMPLTPVLNGDDLVIEGYRFQRAAGDPLPTVLVTDGRGRQVKLPVGAGDFEGDLGGAPTLQRITLAVPKNIAGDLRIAVQAPSGARETPPILTIRPTLAGSAPSALFPALMGGFVRLRGDGFDPEKYDVVLDLDGAKTLVSPTLDGGLSNVATLQFALPSALAAGVYDVKVRWRDETEDAEGSPALTLAVMGAPAIDAVSPGAARFREIIRLDGRNFGDNPDPLFVNFRVVHSGVISGADVLRAQSTGVTPPDQTGFLWTKPILGYDDPVPGTEELEPMTVAVSVTTPQGTSAETTFTIETDAEPEFARSLVFPHLMLQEVIDYANQDPEPAGEIETRIVCDFPIMCEDVPAFAGRCVTDYPDSYIPEPDPFFAEGDIGTLGITPPPGRPEALGMLCNSCDVSGPAGCPLVEGPIGWVGIPPGNIRDTIEFLPSVDNPGDIDLGLVTPGTALTGPDVLLDVSMTPNAFGKFVGGGFHIEGDGMDGMDLRIGTIGTWSIFDGTDTVITISDARGVDLTVDITGAPADIGVLLERCRNVSITGRVQGCTQGIVVRDCEDVELGVEVSGCATGIEIDGGGLNQVTAQLGYRLADAGDAITIPTGQMVGIRLTGGTAGNLLHGIAVVGCDAGVVLDDCTNNLVEILSVGSWFDGTALEVDITDSVGASTRNNVGIQVTDGATNNTISALAGPGVPSLLGPNDIGILLDGGSGNNFGNLQVGFNPVPGLFATPMAGIGNDTGMKVEGDATGNIVRGVVFAGNVNFGLLIADLTESNDFEQIFFGLRPALLGIETLEPNGAAGLMVGNTQTLQRIGRCFFRGETKSILVDGSSNIDFRSNTMEEPVEAGVVLSQCAGISFTGDRVCGGTISVLDGMCDTSAPSGMVGILNIASGGTRLTSVVVQGIAGAGLEFAQPPMAGGAVRVESPADQGSVVPPPLRDDPFDPLNEPPDDRLSGGAAVVISDNTGNGVVIRDGARDIALVGIGVFDSGEHGVALSAAGPNIRLEESFVVGNAKDAVHISSTTTSDVRIGSSGRGNHLLSNGESGVFIGASSGIAVQGNFLGGNGTGGGLDSDNVLIVGSNDVLIGGPEAEAPNLLADGERDGVRVVGFKDFPADPIRIEANFIGVDAGGGEGPGNDGWGVYLTGGAGAQPNGAIEVVNNLIGGSALGGVHLDNWGTDVGPILDGNVIGVWPRAGVLRGEAARGGETIGAANGGDGIALTSVGHAIAQRNKIGANSGDGIALTGSSSTIIRGNEFSGHSGTAITLALASNDNLVEVNEATANGDDAIVVASGSLRNSLLRNSLTANAGRGIALETGGNSGISAPVLQSVVKQATGEYAVRGIIPDAVADGSRVELFADEDDEARLVLAVAYTLNRQFSFFNVAPPPGETLDGKSFRATVTDLRGNTSELGGVGDGPPPRTPLDCPDLPGTPFDVLVASERGGEIALTNVATCDTATTWPDVELDRRPSARTIGAAGRLAFASERDGNREIYFSDGGGAGLQRLTTNSVVDDEPALNPEGDRIAFISNRTGSPEIHLMDTDGSNEVRVTNLTGTEMHPNLSRDGARVVFASDLDGLSSKIYTVTTDGQMLTQHTSLPGDALDPEWHPSKDLVAFQYCPDDATACQVGILDVTTNTVTLLPNSGWSDEQPTWLATPGGDDYLIVSSRPDASSMYHLYLMTTDGYLLWRITPDDVEDRDPSCCLPAPPTEE